MPLTQPLPKQLRAKETMAVQQKERAGGKPPPCPQAGPQAPCTLVERACLGDKCREECSR